MSRTLGLIVALAVMTLILVFAGPAACNAVRRANADAETGQRQVDAISNSAIDAVKSQSSLADREQESADLGRANEKEIRDAEGSDTRIGEPAHTAGLRALCKRAAYSQSPRCRVLNAR